MYQELSKFAHMIRPGSRRNQEQAKKGFAAIVDLVSGGEYSTLCGQKEEQVVAFGDSKHKHRMQNQPWNPEYGDSVKDFTKYTAIYRNLYECVCGYEMIRSERALL